MEWEDYCLLAALTSEHYRQEIEQYQEDEPSPSHNEDMRTGNSDPDAAFGDLSCRL